MNTDWQHILMYLAPIGIALASGKMIRRVLFLPAEYLARKSKSKVVEVLVTEGERDVGIDTPTIPEDSTNVSKPQ